MATMTESPVVGAVTDTGATVVARSSAAADVKVEYANNSSFTSSTTTSEVSTVSGDDFTAHVALSSLSASTEYFYRVLVDGVVQSTETTQNFTTFPSSSTADCSFVVFADVANADRAAAAYNNGNQEDPLFAMQIGDMDHRNPANLSEMRSMWRDMKDATTKHGDKFARHISANMGIVKMWDDHDYGGNDEDRFFSARSDAWQAFDENWPTYSRPNASAGLWHSFVCGAAEIFVLDLRSQRDAGADTDNSSKSMLDGGLISDDQKDWLKDGLSDSTRTWKIIVSSVTTNADVRPNSIDIWHSYSTEAQEIADYIVDEEIENVVVLSGDFHSGGAIDDGSNGLFGVPEMSVAHTNLSGGNSSNLGTWSEGVTSGVNGKGYGLVEVTNTSLTLTAKAQNGTTKHCLTL